MRALRSQPACSEAACEAQPEVCPAGTPGLGSSRPARGTQNHSVTFFNTAFRGIALHWMQPNATARAFAEIEPIGRRLVRTYTGDVWQAWAPSSSGSKPRLLMEYVVGPTEIRGDCACSDVPLLLCPPRQPDKHDPASRPSYEPAGFINFAGITVDVYVLGGKSAQGAACETKLASLQPSEQVHFASWKGQTFRIRRHGDSGNQQLLQQHVVGEVHIRDCEPLGRPVHGSLPGGSTAEAEAEAEERGAAACLLKVSAALAEQRRWSHHQVRAHCPSAQCSAATVCAPVCQLERLTGYLVKERQRRDEERAEQQARIEQLERTVAALVARLDVDGRNNHHREAPEEPTSQPLPWQPQPRGDEGADATPSSEASDQSASLATESGGDGSRRTQVQVDAMGGTHAAPD